MVDKKKLNETPEENENEKDASKIGGVPDATDDKGVDETLGDYNTEEEEIVKVGGLQAHRGEDGVEELTVENVMEDSLLRYAMSMLIDRALPDIRDG